MTSHDCVCAKPLKKFDNGNEYHNFNCPQRSAVGLMCHKHFEMRNPRRMQWQIDECEDCTQAHKENAERIQRTQTIDPEQPYGNHITLVCKNHPTKRWHTKNIEFIGARTLFFSGDSTHDHDAEPTYVPHSFLREGVYGPLWMRTPCHLRYEFFGDAINNTELDCDCDCKSGTLVPLRKWELEHASA